MRATMMRFAPFCASCFATLLPMPSEAPNRRTVLTWLSDEAEQTSGRVAHTLPLTSNLFLLKNPIMVGRSTRRPIRILAIVQEFKVTAMLKKICVPVSMEITLKLVI